jgi:cytochrome c
MHHPTLFTLAIVSLFSFAPASAEGDITKGKSDFKKCKGCHAIASADKVIMKGGKTGPNLYGVIGRAAGSLKGFKYSPSMLAAGESGLIWDEEQLEQFVLNPKAFLALVTGDAKAKSKMTTKLKKGADVAAYLASVGPVVAPDEDGETVQDGDS